MDTGLGGGLTEDVVVSDELEKFNKKEKMYRALTLRSTQYLMEIASLKASLIKVPEFEKMGIDEPDFFEREGSCSLFEKAIFQHTEPLSKERKRAWRLLKIQKNFMPVLLRKLDDLALSIS